MTSEFSNFHRVFLEISSKSLTYVSIHVSDSPIFELFNWKTDGEKDITHSVSLTNSTFTRGSHHALINCINHNVNTFKMSNVTFSENFLYNENAQIWFTQYGIANSPVQFFMDGIIVKNNNNTGPRFIALAGLGNVPTQIGLSNSRFYGNRDISTFLGVDLGTSMTTVNVSELW